MINCLFEVLICLLFISLLLLLPLLLLLVLPAIINQLFLVCQTSGWNTRFKHFAIRNETSCFRRTLMWRTGSYCGQTLLGSCFITILFPLESNNKLAIFIYIASALVKSEKISLKSLYMMRVILNPLK